MQRASEINNSANGHFLSQSIIAYLIKMEDGVSFEISGPPVDKGGDQKRFSEHVGVSTWETLIKQGLIINRHMYYLIIHLETDN